MIKIIVIANVLTSECGDDLPHLDWAMAAELSDGQLHIVERFTDNQKHDDIRDKESTSAVFIRSEWKSPYISKSHRHSNTRHEEFHWVRPLLTIRSVIRALKY